MFRISALGFAVTGSYPLAIALLMFGDAASLAVMSLGRTVVQLMVPPQKRGRIVGAVRVMTTAGRPTVHGPPPRPDR